MKWRSINKWLSCLNRKIKKLRANRLFNVNGILIKLCLHCAERFDREVAWSRIRNAQEVFRKRLKKAGFTMRRHHPRKRLSKRAS